MIKEKNYRLIKAIKESCKCNKEDSGGGGLTGNIIDDWVNAVTQGEYTKYEDVPEAKNGENPGWTKGLRGVATYKSSSMYAGITNYDSGEDFEMFKDSVWDTNPK